MDWFGFGRRSNLPQPTPLQQQRSKQIETLKQLNSGIREIQRDSEYRLGISCPNGLSLCIHLNLPPNFPQDKPRVSISPPAVHPWVDPSSLVVIGAPALNNFSVHSDLSRALREVVDEFQRRPPTPLPPVIGAASPPLPPHSGAASAASTTSGIGVFSPGVLSASSGPYLNGFASGASGSPPKPTMASAMMGTTLVSSSSHASPSHLPAKQNQYYFPPHPSGVTPPHPGLPPQQPLGFMGVENHFALNHSPSPPPGLLPPVPSVIPSLRDKSTGELKELSNDEGSLYAAITELPDIKCLEINRIKIVQQTEESAKKNLEHRPKVDELKEELKRKYQELETLKSKVDGKIALQSEKMEGRSLPHLQDKLKIAVMEADEESETIAESFLDGKLPLDQFLKNYKSKRKLSHHRKMCEEKLGSLIYTGQVGDY